MKSQEILAFFYHSYKLTLLSNNAEGDCGEVMLCSHTKLHYSQTQCQDLKDGIYFVPLQNYTTLKPMMAIMLNERYLMRNRLIIITFFITLAPFL